MLTSSDESHAQVAQDPTSDSASIGALKLFEHGDSTNLLFTGADATPIYDHGMKNGGNEEHRGLAYMPSYSDMFPQYDYATRVGPVAEQSFMNVPHHSGFSSQSLSDLVREQEVQRPTDRRHTESSAHSQVHHRPVYTPAHSAAFPSTGLIGAHNFGSYLPPQMANQQFQGVRGASYQGMPMAAMDNVFFSQSPNMAAEVQSSSGKYQQHSAPHSRTVTPFGGSGTSISNDPHSSSGSTPSSGHWDVQPSFGTDGPFSQQSSCLGGDGSAEMFSPAHAAVDGGIGDYLSDKQVDDDLQDFFDRETLERYLL